MEKKIVFGDISKPNPRFDRNIESNDVTTSKESAIRSKVKELEKAIRSNDITMGDSQLLGNKTDFDEP